MDIGWLLLLVIAAVAWRPLSQELRRVWAHTRLLRAAPSLGLHADPDRGVAYGRHRGRDVEVRVRAGVASGPRLRIQVDGGGAVPPELAVFSRFGDTSELGATVAGSRPSTGDDAFDREVALAGEEGMVAAVVIADVRAPLRAAVAKRTAIVDGKVVRDLELRGLDLAACLWPTVDELIDLSEAMRVSPDQLAVRLARQPRPTVEVEPSAVAERALRGEDGRAYGRGRESPAELTVAADAREEAHLLDELPRSRGAERLALVERLAAVGVSREATAALEPIVALGAVAERSLARLHARIGPALSGRLSVSVAPARDGKLSVAGRRRQDGRLSRPVAADSSPRDGDS